MGSAELVVLMIVVPLAVMLFVAWGVRGPSVKTMRWWRLWAKYEFVIADKDKKMAEELNRQRSALKRYAEKMNADRLIYFKRAVNKMRPSMIWTPSDNRPVKPAASADAAEE